MTPASGTAVRIRTPKSMTTGTRNARCSWLPSGDPITASMSSALSSTAKLTAIAASVERRDLWSGNRHFALRRPLKIDVRFDDGAWCYDCAELHLAGCASSYEAALSRLGHEFAFLWDDVATEEDVALHASGMRLKELLVGLVADAG